MNKTLNPEAHPACSGYSSVSPPIVPLACSEDGAAAGRLLWSSVARHASAISRSISASTVLRPVASRRTCLTDILWSASAQGKSAFSTSSSFHTPAVTQHAPYFKGTAVVNGEFKELSLDDFKGKYLVLFFYPWISHLCVLQKLLLSVTKPMNFMM